MEKFTEHHELAPIHCALLDSGALGPGVVLPE